MKNNDERVLSTLLSGKVAKKYEGKQVVVCAGQVYILPEDDRKSNDFLKTLIVRHPKSTPTIAFVPKHGTYILILQ